MEFGICTNVWLLCSNWTWQVRPPRTPSSLIGALIKKYWPGMYTPVPGGQKKLAYTWADYKAADCIGFGKASDAVITKFWVRHLFLKFHS